MLILTQYAESLSWPNCLAGPDVFGSVIMLNIDVSRRFSEIEDWSKKPTEVSSARLVTVGLSLQSEGVMNYFCRSSVQRASLLV